MSLVLKYCSSRKRTKFRHTSNTSKLEMSVSRIVQKLAELDPEPSQLAEPHMLHNVPCIMQLAERALG